MDLSWLSVPPSLPAQILIHLFCAHMDGLLPADPRADKNKPFSSLYYVLAPKSPGAYHSRARQETTPNAPPPRHIIIIQQPN